MQRIFWILLIMLGAGLAAAQPPEITGEAVYIPFPVAISADGDLRDWDGIPPVTVNRGPRVSADPVENGSFTFALAADADNLYLYMTMPDRNIITGQHGADTWNEDSLEFYLNLSRDRFATSYNDLVFQVRISPAGLGEAPVPLTISGQNVTGLPLTGVAFRTDDGWGFEAALSLRNYITPQHGLEIGFQAQANGASRRDRDVKLIWSNRDSGDTSWQNPAVFGAGLFFRLGEATIPTPRPQPEEESMGIPRSVRVNQVGYFPDGSKFGVLPANRDGSAIWRVRDAAGSIAAEGQTTEAAFDEASGDRVQTADFSALTAPGTYTLEIDGLTSAPFVIGSDIYAGLRVDALRYFYLNRSGIPLEAQYAGQWARPAGHMTDNNVTCFKGRDAMGKDWPGCDYTLDGSGGWYDAGDYGKYVVNGGISVWTLLNLYERWPDAFADGDLNIPESGNGVPDILDEVRWQMDFMLRMQVPDGQPQAGMAFHKLHDLVWAGIPVLPPTEYDNDNDHTDPNGGRYVYPPSTAATLNLAATAAQCARVWAETDAAFAARCLTAAEKAWDAAAAHPIVLAGSTPGRGGGDYSDMQVSDEFFWAAAELYITTGKTAYGDFVTASPFFRDFTGRIRSSVSSMSWPETAALGGISLALLPNGLPEADTAALREQIIAAADRYLRRIEAQGYRVPLPVEGYFWGSNSNVLNNAVVLALAYDFSGEQRYLDGVTACMDYILGLNAVDISFVSGYGVKAMQHPHHRFWGNNPAAGFPPPPPGALAGGPLGTPQEDATRNLAVMDAGPAKRYADVIGAYSSNEVAINWNAPLAWVATYLHQRFSAQPPPRPGLR